MRGQIPPRRYHELRCPHNLATHSKGAAKGSYARRRGAPPPRADLRAWPVYHPSLLQSGAPRLRLLTFAVSVRGALGSKAQTFIRQLSARMAGAVPYRLLDEASWATQGCAPLLRSAIAFSARRALAAGIRRSTCSAAEALRSVLRRSARRRPGVLLRLPGGPGSC